MKILLVEDSDTDALLARETIKQSGQLAADVQWVKTLAEAQQFVRDCDLLLADLNLPDAEMEQVTAFCRAIRSAKLVVILTGYYGSEAPRLAGKLGLGFLRKPVSQTALLDEIHRAEGILEAIQEHNSVCQHGIDILDKAESESQLARQS